MRKIKEQKGSTLHFVRLFNTSVIFEAEIKINCIPLRWLQRGNSYIDAI